ncbi:hypothetical protein PENTCL1PPCAC_23078, partial [Pristionchus entomophagus]
KRSVRCGLWMREVLDVDWGEGSFIFVFVRSLLTIEESSLHVLDDVGSHVMPDLFRLQFLLCSDGGHLGYPLILSVLHCVLEDIPIVCLEPST